jgi:hypothetical protein
MWQECHLVSNQAYKHSHIFERQMHARHTTLVQHQVFAAFAKWRHNDGLQHCLADGEGCAGRVIKTHSIQSAYIMQYLARAGHGYMVQADSQRHLLSLIGYRKATALRVGRSVRGLRSFCPRR